jgi:hypothetical protein
MRRMKSFCAISVGTVLLMDENAAVMRSGMLSSFSPFLTREMVFFSCSPKKKSLKKNMAPKNPIKKKNGSPQEYC